LSILGLRRLLERGVKSAGRHEQKAFKPLQDYLKLFLGHDTRSIEKMTEIVRPRCCKAFSVCEYAAIWYSVTVHLNGVLKGDS
jgi:hypothetical protein